MDKNCENNAALLFSERFQDNLARALHAIDSITNYVNMHDRNVLSRAGEALLELKLLSDQNTLIWAGIKANLKMTGRNLTRDERAWLKKHLHMPDLADRLAVFSLKPSVQQELTWGGIAPELTGALTKSNAYWWVMKGRKLHVEGTSGAKDLGYFLATYGNHQVIKLPLISCFEISLSTHKVLGSSHNMIEEPGCSCTVQEMQKKMVHQKTLNSHKRVSTHTLVTEYHETHFLKRSLTTKIYVDLQTFYFTEKR